MVIVWLVVAVLAAIGEVLTTTLFLVCVAAAAVIVAILSLVVPFFTVQVLVFAALSLLGILAVRPLVVGTLGLDALVHHSGEVTQSRMIGRSAVVTRTVDAHGGQVRVGEGEFWSARLYGGDEALPPGRRVEIMFVDGLTALVAPSPASLPEDTSAVGTRGEA
ncbi:MAG TPA: NfeD family protein [Chloroflexota bacterium]|nr:NfeD family protein [Chloroflexota bacterium]